MKLALDADATVVGYWSDNTANVELALSIRNESERRLDGAVPIAVACNHDGEVVNDCGHEMSVSLADGYASTSDTVTLRVPAGDVSFSFAYGEAGTQSLDLNVPERILGVDRDVWACFSDTSKVDTVWEEDEGIGCAAWAKESILKWDQALPVTVSINGPDGFAEEFKNVLNDLSPILNLQFEWVGTDSEANIAAHIGLTASDLHSQDVFCFRADAFGCADTLIDGRAGRVKSGEIIVYNLWPEEGADLGEFDQQTRERFKAAMIHEAVHALSRMNHRTEVLSIMNDAVHLRAELSPMDQALLRLHGHRLARPGMTIAELEGLIVFNDDLIDPRPPDPRLTAWKLASNAYRELREATTASFRVRSSFPDCSTEFGWADYEVGNLTRFHPYFVWVRIEDDDNLIYVLQPLPDESEYWRQLPTGWSGVSLDNLSDALSGWRGDLSDPHHMLESILYHADWTDAGVSVDADGRARLQFQLDRVRGPATAPVESVSVVVTIDEETYTISDYGMEWRLRGDGCEAYRIEATGGRYGTYFALPDAVRHGSDFIESCEAQSLDPLGGYVRVSQSWHRECLAIEGYARSYRFSLDGWSFVRFDVASADDALLKLWKQNYSGGEMVEPEAAGYLEGGHGVPDESRLYWAHVPLPAGEYTAEVVTRNRASPGDFTFTLANQPTPPPPYRFKSISVSGNRSCGLLLDGTPLCWGLRNVEGRGWVPPDGKFASISVGAHTCALREDGTPVCWDFKQEGKHTCGPKDGGTYCRLDDQESPTDRPPDLDGGAVSVRSVWVTAGYYDQTPPPGERLASISTDWVHSCGLRQDGTPVCWGSDQDGKASPPPGEKFLSIDAGSIHSCGLRQDSTAVCWGAGYHQRLRVPEGERFVAIAVGEDHSCGLREDGSTACWGGRDALSICTSDPGGFYSCLSVGTVDHLPLAPPERERFASLAGDPYCGLTVDGRAVCWTNYQSGLVPAPEGERFTSISSSSQHACALRADGTAACWGRNRHGQASPPSGINLTNHQVTDQAPVGLVSISSGHFQTCALDSDGDAVCWGPNWWKGRFADRFASISSGGAHACGVRLDGTVACRGANDLGQSLPPDETFVSVTSGGEHTCGLRDDGTVACWGRNNYGQASPPEETFSSISSGSLHVCGLRSDGTAVCWGYLASARTPASTGEVFSFISSGGAHTCALRVDGTPVCRGLNEDGQASPPEESFASISSGAHHTCALRSDGTPVCWGWNSSGQASPPANEVFVSISSGGSHTCGLRADGTVVCWGENRFSQATPRR
ncbi:MAG: hypothetical protein J4F43_05125 [Dehalococcoidia bacterium]|nr:hypothetical protein [Dehalococcoidia bacterium]